MKLTTFFVLSSLLLVAFGSEQRQIKLKNHVIHTIKTPQTTHENVESGVEYQWLVHFSPSFTQADIAAINDELQPYSLGAYFPENTYLLYAPEEIAKKAEELKLVLWVGAFLPEYKLSPRFYEIASQAAAGTTLLVNLPQIPIGLPQRTKQAAQAIAQKWTDSYSATGVTFEAKAINGRRIVVTVSPIEKLYQVGQWVAEQPESHWIEVSSKKYFQNNYVNKVIKSNAQNDDIVGKIDALLSGSSQIVALGDTGLDTTSCFFAQSATANDTTNLDLEKIIRYAVAPADSPANPTTPTGDKVDADGHGTFMASIIAGKSSSSNTEYNGIARDAKIYFWDLSTAGFNTPIQTDEIREVLDYYDTVLYDGASARDINVWVLPFGANGTDWYSIFSEDLDSWANSYPFTLLVVPSGNDPVSRTLIDSAFSKNALVVGASESTFDAAMRPITGQPSINVNHTALHGTQALASFSGVGPTPDGRIKPDVVAPGSRIIGAAKGTCGTETREGTSYAAAAAAGAAAIVGDYFYKSYYDSGYSNPPVARYNPPSAALVKAMLINSGQSLNIANSGSQRYLDLARAWPSAYQGFGRIQLDRVLFFRNETTDETSDFALNAVDDGDGYALNEKDTYRSCFMINPNARYVKFTLVWMEPASDPASGTVLLNNLDLVVYDKKGTEWRSSTADGDWDQLNNVEQVYMTNPAAGVYAVAVHATKLNAAGTQKWAMVITGDATFSLSCDGLLDNVTHPVCPNQCSGRGKCSLVTPFTSPDPVSQCTCDSGYRGVDCSIPTCNCNNNGVCDFVTGECICGKGYDPSTACRDFAAAPVDVTPPPPEVIREEQSNQVGYYVGIGILGLVVGGLIFGVLGFFGAVKLLNVVVTRLPKEKEVKLK